MGKRLGGDLENSRAWGNVWEGLSGFGYDRGNVKTAISEIGQAFLNVQMGLSKIQVPCLDVQTGMSEIRASCLDVGTPLSERGVERGIVCRGAMGRGERSKSGVAATALQDAVAPVEKATLSRSVLECAREAKRHAAFRSGERPATGRDGKGRAIEKRCRCHRTPRRCRASRKGNAVAKRLGVRAGSEAPRRFPECGGVCQAEMGRGERPKSGVVRSAVQQRAPNAVSSAFANKLGVMSGSADSGRSNATMQIEMDDEN